VPDSNSFTRSQTRGLGCVNQRGAGQASGSPSQRILDRLIEIEADVRLERLAGSGRHFRSVDDDVSRVCAAAAIRGLSAFNGDRHSNLRRFRCPPALREATGAAQLERPVGDFAGFLIGDVDLDIRVRILPFDSRHCTGKLQGPR